MTVNQISIVAAKDIASATILSAEGLQQLN
jgi:hypothetical protein